MYEDDCIIISYFTLRSLLPPKFKKMSERYNVMCDCEWWISDKSMHSSLIYRRDRYLKNPISEPKCSKKKVWWKSHHIHETYISTTMPHGRHIYAKASSMAQATMCAYPQSGHALPHWKCVLRWCTKCPCVNIPYQEIDNHNSDIAPSIRFHIYHIISRCTAHGRIPLKDKKIYYMCKQ